MKYQIQTQHHYKSGFTLVEVLVATSVIGLLSGIVITAINPKRQITNAQVVRRAAIVKQVNDELERMVVASTDLAEEIPIGADNAIRLCTPGAASNLSGCTTKFETLFDNVVLSDDEDIGYDVDYPDSYTEFVVYKEPGGKVKVGSIYPTESGDEMPPPSSPPCAEGGNPYQICTKETLENIANIDAFGAFILMTDLDLSGYTFEPIQNFHGLFEGNGHTITHLYINKPFDNDIGLFGRLTGDVQNLTVSNASVSGGSNVGILVGRNAKIHSASHSNITNVTVSGTVSGFNQVGGVIGQLDQMGGGILTDAVAENVDIYATYTAGSVIGLKGTDSQMFGCSAVNTQLHDCLGTCNAGCSGLCGGEAAPPVF